MLEVIKKPNSVQTRKMTPHFSSQGFLKADFLTVLSDGPEMFEFMSFINFGYLDKFACVAALLPEHYITID